MPNFSPDSPAARGERSDSERSEGIRLRGRSPESEVADKPPHPICFASQGLRSQIDLSPHAGRGGASGTAPSCRRVISREMPDEHPQPPALTERRLAATAVAARLP